MRHACAVRVPHSSLPARGHTTPPQEQSSCDTHLLASSAGARHACAYHDCLAFLQVVRIMAQHGQGYSGGLTSTWGSLGQQGTHIHQQYAFRDASESRKPPSHHKHEARSHQLPQACDSVTAFSWCLSPCVSLTATCPLVAAHIVKASIAEDMGGDTTVQNDSTP